jgi:hypothetical protein
MDGIKFTESKRYTPPCRRGAEMRISRMKGMGRGEWTGMGWWGWGGGVGGCDEWTEKILANIMRGG